MRKSNLRYWFSFLVLLTTLRIFAQQDRNGYPIVLHQPPEADFSWSHACYGDTTTFINASIRANTYTWTIYNKSLIKIDSSNAVNISFYFPAIDTFYVRLDADNGHPASSYQMVIIDSVLTADFSFMHCSNEFLSHSTCTDSLRWNFGDGASSNSSLPVHQYADTGYYNVTLIAYKGNTSDTVTKQIFVDPQAFPTGATTWHLVHDTLFVHAVDSMAGMQYNWNFGMGVHILKRDSFYVLPDTGTYIINFSDWNTCGTAYGMDTVKYYNNLNEISNHSLLNRKLTLYPNPNSGEFFIINFPETISEADISVFNSLGEELPKQAYSVQNISKGIKLNFIHACSGLYHVRVNLRGSYSHFSFLLNK